MDRKTLLQNALDAVEKMQARLLELERSRTEPIAIVGMACRFPGGVNTPESYWQLLREGRLGVREVPSDRWDVNLFYNPDPKAPGKMSTRYAGFLDCVDQFDAHFFGISPREALSLDPQQRLLLEVTWEALEHAGIAPHRLLRTETGVFIGITTSDYSKRLNFRDIHTDVYAATGNALNAAAGRISFTLGLQGPCMAIDTACSSSLVAVHEACQSLRLNECTAAIAGGVNVILSPDPFILFSKWGMLAPDERCKAFDAKADGFVRAEGCGALILKRYSDAVSSHDRILALIRGSAVNQDGRSSGLTVPNGLAQQAVIRRALKSAAIEPSEVSYVEAHGTGTPIGDPIEVEALAAIYGTGRDKELPLEIGSVKTNLGHLEAASGIAGLMKVILCLQHQELVPHLHLHELNPRISWDAIPVVVPTGLRGWNGINGRRIAGVSSFGFSGTNAHLVVEASTRFSSSEGHESMHPPVHLLTLSAQDKPALTQLAGIYGQHLETHHEQPIHDVCHSANAGRSHFRHRLAILGENAEILRERLRHAADPNSACMRGVVRNTDAPRVAFLFTGQGSQYIGMGSELYSTQPTFRRVIDFCCDRLTDILPMPLLDVLYRESNAQSMLDQTGYAQPALFALEVALAELWKSWGIIPDMVMGHSVGEYAAACVAGLFNIEDGIRLIAERGRLMQALPPGGQMVAIEADPDFVSDAIRDYSDELSLAVVNGPQSVVISGSGKAMGEVLAKFSESKVRTQPLNVTHAFHSALMDPMLEDFRKIAATVNYSQPDLEFVSNLTGELVNSGNVDWANYWVRHVRKPVQFAKGIRTLASSDCRICIELGPNPVLLGLGRRCLDNTDIQWLPSLRKGIPDWSQLLDSAARLYVGGRDLDWSGFDRDYACSIVTVPSYPFQRKRYWIPDCSAVPLLPESINADQDGGAIVENSLYALQWQAYERQQGNGDCKGLDFPGKWILFCDQGGVGRRVMEELTHKGLPATCVYPGDRYEVCGGTKAFIRSDEGQDYIRLAEEISSAGSSPVSGVLYFWGMDAVINEITSPVDLEKLYQFSVGSLHLLIQAFARTLQPHPPKLWVATCRGQSESPDSNPVAVLQSSLWGLGRVADQELPEFWGGCVDFSPGESHEEIENFIQDFLQPGREKQIIYRGGRRLVARIVHNKPATLEKMRCSEDAVYLITGGLGGLGLCIARELVQCNARHLVLMGRRGLTPEIQVAIDELRQKGAEVVVEAADVAKREDVQGVLDRISASKYPLRGVVHAAGTVRDGVLLNLHWLSFAEVMAPKITGSWNLHVLTREIPLDFFVLFSSMASLAGSPGQSNYAAANAFLDGLARHRRSLELPALCINWGAWANVGMTRVLGPQDAARRTRIGLRDIQPLEGMAVFSRLVRGGSGQIAVLPIDWQTFLTQFQRESIPVLFTALIPELTDSSDDGAPGSTVDVSPLLERIRNAPANAKKELVFDHIKERVIEVFRLDASQPIDFQEGLTQLGMDSLMALELRNLLQTDFHEAIPASVIFECPTLGELSKYIVRGFFTEDIPNLSKTDSAQVKEPVRPDRTLADMSDDEAERSLLDELDRWGF